jgi:chaperone required for assembly of F1-ATPase
MPLMRLAVFAIDWMPTRRDDVTRRLAAHAGTDLVCHRAAEPPALVERQEAAWQPLVEWAGERFGARLRITRGILAIEQAPEAIAALRGAIEARDDWPLAALRQATALTGSIVIALALLEGRLDPASAAAAADLDEVFQAERWGWDREAVRPARGEGRGAGRRGAVLAVAGGLTTCSCSEHSG